MNDDEGLFGSIPIGEVGITFGGAREIPQELYWGMGIRPDMLYRNEDFERPRFKMGGSIFLGGEADDDSDELGVQDLFGSVLRGKAKRK